MIRKRVRELAAAGRSQALDLLKALVETNSYWDHPDGVNRAGALALEAFPKSLEGVFTPDTRGVRHHILAGPSSARERILLVGHLDTVFPPESETTP
ncbi:MAG: hypothetical protein JSV70_07415, partial [bacterium]